MKANWLGFTLLLLSSAVVSQLSAQKPIKSSCGSQGESRGRRRRFRGRPRSRYDEGKGVAQDHAEAVKWYRKAVEQNLDKAQFNLSVRYDRGEGVAKDQIEAVRWSPKAAEQNLATAQHMLGVCYAAGEGVAKDQVEAYKWLLLTAGQGDENAKKAMTMPGNKMTPEKKCGRAKAVARFQTAVVTGAYGRGQHLGQGGGWPIRRTIEPTFHKPRARQSSHSFGRASILAAVASPRN